MQAIILCENYTPMGRIIYSAQADCNGNSFSPVTAWPDSWQNSESNSHKCVSARKECVVHLEIECKSSKLCVLLCKKIAGHPKLCVTKLQSQYKARVLFLTWPNS